MIEGEKSTFADRFYRTLYEVALRVSQTKAQKMDDFFGVLFKAIKVDKSVPRVVAFVKRLLQMTFANEASFTCACLLVVNEVLRSRPDVRFVVFGNAKKSANNRNVMNEDSSDEEVFVDADKEPVSKSAEENKQERDHVESSKYDALKREPKFANAENEPMWELVTLSRHCHPTVAMWAQELLKGELLEYEGDPLLDFGLANFLDRISFKVPKSEEKIRQHR